MLINSGRIAGKTIRIILYAYIYKKTIICKTAAEKKRIILLADKLGLKIKEPKTLEELKVIN